MSAPHQSSEAVGPPLPPYILTTAEQQFVSRYLEPRFATFRQSINTLINDRNTTASDAIEVLLNNSVAQAKDDVMAILRTEFKEKFSLTGLEAKINDGLKEGFASVSKSCLTALDEEFNNLKRTLPTSSMAEPPVLPGVTFDGVDARKVPGFVNSMRESLVAHSSSFVSDDRRIIWVSKHFPLGSSTHDWWMSLLRQNDRVNGVSESDGFSMTPTPFTISPLSSITAFFKEFLEKFGDKFAEERLFLELQNFRQQKLHVNQFISRFNQMAHQLQLSQVVLKNLFTAGLRADLKDRALKHPDWFKCSTVEERQAIATMASEQMIHVNANSVSFGHSHSMTRSASSPPVISIPRDPNAMDVDVNAMNSRRTFPALPAGVSF